MIELEVTSSVWDTGCEEFYCGVRKRQIVRLTAKQHDKFLAIEYEKTGVKIVDDGKHHEAKEKLMEAMKKDFYGEESLAYFLMS